MKKIALLLTLVIGLPFVARATTLEQIVPREHPDFDTTRATMEIGRDGLVYLTSTNNLKGYVLRLSRSGEERRGGNVTYASGSAAANTVGKIATATAHFTHSILLYDRNFRQTGANAEFPVNDKIGFQNPAHVEAGETDFYGLDGY